MDTREEFSFQVTCKYHVSILHRTIVRKDDRTSYQSIIPVDSNFFYSLSSRVKSSFQNTAVDEIFIHHFIKNRTPVLIRSHGIALFLFVTIFIFFY